jgi:hypothetical protein
MEYCHFSVKPSRRIMHPSASMMFPALRLDVLLAQPGAFVIEAKSLATLQVKRGKARHRTLAPFDLVRELIPGLLNLLDRPGPAARCDGGIFHAPLDSNLIPDLEESSGHDLARGYHP